MVNAAAADGYPALTDPTAELGERFCDLVETVAGLRAVDSFRSRDSASYGLERPHAAIEVVTGRGVRRLVIGDLNAAGSAFYARRAGDPRVLQVGSGLLTGLERVFFNRDGPR